MHAANPHFGGNVDFRTSSTRKKAINHEAETVISVTAINYDSSINSEQQKKSTFGEAREAAVGLG